MTEQNVETIVLNLLKIRPLSVAQIESALSRLNYVCPRRLAKEIAWKLAEEGKAEFNKQWNLELKEDNVTPV